MTTACCVKTGTKYSSEFVNKLARGLNRNGYENKLYCITDNSVNLDLNIVQPIEIPNPDKSWWDKLYIFSWEHGINDTLLYFDIDMVIVGNITCFMDWASFITGSNFDDSKEINSTLMSIPEQYGKELWETYNENREKIKNLHVWDSKYLDFMLGNTIKWQDLQPNKLVSYKYHVYNYEFPKDAKIVSFHGSPNPDEVDDEFVQLNWK